MLRALASLAVARPVSATVCLNFPTPLQFGYYTLLAASMGCRVVAWEPVPFFAAYLKYGLLRNNLTHRVEVRPAASHFN